MVSGGLDNSLQNELQQLANEAKRKHVPIKEAAEQLISLLKRTKEKNLNPVQELSNSQVSLSFFYLSCESQSIKLAGMALNIVQKLIASRTLYKPHDSVPEIVKWCGNFPQSAMDMQLKVLQVLLLLFTHYPTDMRARSVQKTFEISFHMANQGNPIIKNTAGATLKQLSNLLFEKLGEDLKPLPNDTMDDEGGTMVMSASAKTVLNGLKPVERDAYLVFHDLCALVKYDRPYWLNIEDISKMLGLDLMESIISANSKIFKSVPEFLNLMKDEVCPLALYFTDKASFAHSMRMTRLVWILIRDFHLVLPMECEIFVSMLIKLLDSEHLIWQKALAAEVLKLICVEDGIFYSLFMSFDMKLDAPNVISRILHGMANYVKRVPTEKKTQHKIDTSQAPDLPATLYVLGETLALKVPCLDQFDKVDHPPSLSENYPLWLILQSIFCLGDRMLAEVTVIFSQKSGTKTLRDIDIDNHLRKEDIIMFSKILETSWSSVLIVLSEVLRVGMDENFLKQIFKSCLAWVRVCGILEITIARNTILQELCHLGLHHTELENSDEDKCSVRLTRTNLFALRCLLSALSALSEVLESTWGHVLEALLVADRLAEIFSAHFRQPGGLMIIPANDRVANENEIQMFRQSLNKLFENVQFFSNRGFFYFLKGLCAVDYEDNSAGAETTSVLSKMRISKDRIFANSVMKRLKDFCLWNLRRLSSRDLSDSWNLAIQHLLGLSLSSNAVSRTQATEVLSTVLRSVIESSSNEFTLENFHYERVFETLESMTNIHWIDVQKTSLITQKVIVEASGQSIPNHVWQLVIRAIAQLVTDPSRSSSLEVVKIGFQILQLIGNEFLMYLDIEGLIQCIECMGIYGSRVQDLNVNLGAIGLLWNMADYLSTRGDRQADKCWDPKVVDSLYIDLLSQLAKLCENGHPDVRNGAAHTLFRAFTVHGRTLQQQTLRSSFDQIMYCLMEMIMGGCPDIAIGTLSKDSGNSFSPSDKDVRLSVHHSEENLQKQWEETQILVVNGISKLFEEYLAQLVQFKDILNVWKTYMSLVWFLTQSNSKDVILGTTEALCNILNMTLGQDLLNEQQYLKILWREAFSFWKLIPNNIFNQKNDISVWTEKAIDFFVSSFRGIYSMLELELPLSDLQLVLEIFYRCILVKTPDSFHDDAVMSPIQVTIMELSEMIEIIEDRVPIIVLHYLRLCDLPFRLQNLDRMNAEYDIKPENPYIFFLISRMSILRVSNIFIIYANSTFIYMNGTFQQSIKTLGGVMNQKHLTDYDAKQALWKIAAAAFKDICNAGTRALHVLGKELSIGLRNACMKSIIEMLSEHLLLTSLSRIPMNRQQFDADQHFSFGIFNSCFCEMFYSMYDYDPSLLQDLLDILNKGSVIDPMDNLQLMKIVTTEQTYVAVYDIISRGCMEILFNITEVDSSFFPSGDHEDYRNSVCKIASSILENRVQSILTIALRTMGGFAAFPLPRARSIELKYLLTRLCDWKPIERYRIQVLSKNQSYFLNIVKYAPEDWIWVQEVYRCLEIIR